MNARCFLLAIVLACSALSAPVTPAAAAQEAGETASSPDSVWISGVLEIGVDGRVESVEFLRSRLKPWIEEKVLDVVRGWQFDAYLVDGRPRPIRTSISLQLELVGEAEQRRLQISQSRFGQPIWASQPAPTYPAASLRLLRSADVLIAVTLDAHGQVIEAEPVQGRVSGVRVRSENAHRKALMPFVNSALAAVRRWRMDFVDPHSEGAPTRFLVPIRYTVAGVRSRPDPRQPPLLFDAASTLGHPVADLAAQIESSEEGRQALPLQPTVRPLADVIREVAL
jgi:hypothetical protein